MSSTFLLIGKIILEVSHSVIRAALCHPFHCSCYFVVPAFEFSSLTFWYRIAIPLKNCNNKLQHNLNYKNAKHHYFHFLCKLIIHSLEIDALGVRELIVRYLLS